MVNKKLFRTCLYFWNLFLVASSSHVEFCCALHVCTEVEFCCALHVCTVLKSTLSETETAIILNSFMMRRNERNASLHPGALDPKVNFL